ncbi:enoyl-CoA hydratase/isomerase family protein [Pollutimonas bauzanensis]|uniref:Enoyl-CoA hydratase/isomerase n=1 Tax=Pollutimonas bauzanensis TaxID=658167 RepID=A0A1M5XYP2_9BURK|nr:enoyl-CoA hydratase/isomerase family protein [Pollutimonas bauzanensis]SHI04373.1 Enoyl-CoA hydratase/isomerase [Pollutimonas bauzanensis]
MQADNDILVQERVSGVWWITINREKKHNALARSVLRELAQAVALAAGQASARCIVLTGAGKRYFAAGGDLVDLASVRDEQATIEMANGARTALDALRNCPLPVIAYLNGDAIGGGAELALACDMRMQGSKARIGFIQAKLAITSAWGGGPDLCQLIGTSRAMRMMSRCELVDPRQALDWGLADAVIGEASVEQDIQAFLDPMLSCPPQVLRGIKAQTRACRQGLAYDERRSVEQRQLIATWLHEDHWSFSEKLLSKGKK